MTEAIPAENTNIVVVPKDDLGFGFVLDFLGRGFFSDLTIDDDEGSGNGNIAKPVYKVH